MVLQYTRFFITGGDSKQVVLTSGVGGIVVIVLFLNFRFDSASVSTRLIRIPMIKKKKIAHARTSLSWKVFNLYARFPIGTLCCVRTTCAFLFEYSITPGSAQNRVHLVINYARPLLSRQSFAMLLPPNYFIYRDLIPDERLCELSKSIFFY